MEKEEYLHSDQHIQNNIANGWEFKFGDYISRGFDYTHKQIGVNIGYTALFCLITGLGAYALMAILVAIALGGDISNVPNINPWTIILPLIIVMPLIYALGFSGFMGFATGTNHFIKKQNSDFSSFWDGYKFLGPLFLFVIIYGLITILWQVLYLTIVDSTSLEIWSMMLSGDFDQDRMRELQMQSNPLLNIISSLLSMLLTFPLLFAPYFIIFHKRKAISAIVDSYKLIRHNYFMVFLYQFVSSIILAVGILLCCIGALYSIPAFANLNYALYEDMTGMNLDSEEDLSFTDTETIDG